jgi:hypothetical protein
MGFAEKEFSDCLPFAVTGRLEALADEPGCYRVIGDGTEVYIRTQRLADRQLGSLSLPVLGVEIRFRGASEQEYSAFMHKFDRHFLRMGG